MTADFYYNGSDEITVDKTITLKESGVTVRYKDDTEMINPTIICESDKINKNINYVHVGSPVNRYYFIDDTTYSQQMVYLKCRVDVLMSYKDQIYDLEGIVERNGSLHNLYITDNKMKLNNLTRTQTVPFEYGFDVNDNKTASYLLVLNGSGEQITPPE